MDCSRTGSNATYRLDPEPHDFATRQHNPLIVVDGFPRPIECLNTVEIESVTVLKDGPATALWGARGANG